MTHENERRDYGKNGYGRRQTDRQPCPFYDMEKHKCAEVEELKKLIVPRWVFALYVTTAGAAMIGLVALAWNFGSKALDKVDVVQTQITDLTVQTSIIDTRQQTVLQDIKEMKRKEMRDERESSVDRRGNDGPEPAAPRNYPTGRLGGD